jgi:hypothetical protein
MLETNVPTVDMPLTGLGNTLFYCPFENSSVYRLVNWFYHVLQAKSVADLDTLVHDVILAKDFDPEHFRNFSTAQEMAQLDAYSATDAPFSANDNWKEGSVKI